MKRPVVLISPLLAPSLIMAPLASRLRDEGFAATIFAYPSYREDIPSNAARLAAFLQEHGEAEVDVVAFSMGGIILRWAANNHALPRIRRAVLVGTPNQGARMAKKANDWFGDLFPLFWGKCARQLQPGDLGLCQRAGRLAEDTELGIIAGGTGRERGVNPILPGDNDRVVTVAETWLEGTDDFVLVRRPHGPLILSTETARLTAHFLREGAFQPGGLRTPHPKAPKPCPT